MGAAEICEEGWLCSDRDALDLFLVRDWNHAFRTTAETTKQRSQADELGKEVGRVQASNFFAEHVLEHFAPAQVETLIASAFLNLQPGGIFRIAVPDGYQPNEKRQLAIRSGQAQQLGGAHPHRTVWHVDSLPGLFRKFGFHIRMREWWDIEGEFRTSGGSGPGGWSNLDPGDPYKDEVDGTDPYRNEANLGRVRRSDKNDHRNPGLRQSLRITSLWFDAVKPAECRDRV